MKFFYMTKTIAFILVISSILASCSAKMDISKDSRFKNLVGHSVTTRVPLKLYEIDYQLDGYKDRYSLGKR